MERNLLINIAKLISLVNEWWNEKVYLKLTQIVRKTNKFPSSAVLWTVFIKISIHIIFWNNKFTNIYGKGGTNCIHDFHSIYLTSSEV